RTVREAFGIALLEARAAGLPLVAMRGGGAGDLVEHGREGFLAETPAEFAAQLRRLAGDPSLRVRLGREAPLRLERFGWDAVIARHLDVYQLALARSPRAGAGARSGGRMIDIVEVTDEIGLDLLEHEWRALADASEECTPFQTFEWMSSWWRHQRRGQLWILTAREQGALVGILPLFISRYHGLPLRRVSFLGTPVSEYHALLARPGRAADCRTAFFAHLAANERRWDVIDLPDLREGSALAESPLLPRLRVQLVHHRVCPFVPLGATWEGYTATLGKNLRSRIGRQTRALSRQFAAEFDEVGPDELRAALEDLFYLHNRRWQKRGLRGAFSDRRIQRFHQDVARRF